MIRFAVATLLVLVSLVLVPRAARAQAWTATPADEVVLLVTPTGAPVPAPATPSEAAPPNRDARPRVSPSAGGPMSEASVERRVRFDVGALGTYGELRLPSVIAHGTDQRAMGLGLVDAGGGVSLGAGVAPSEGHILGAMARLRYAYTQPAGLAAHLVTIGPELHVAFVPALRLVGGVHAAWLAIQRVTRDALVQHWGIGADVGVDVCPFGEHIYLRPEATATLIPTKLVVPSSLVYGGALTLGVRI